MVGDVQGPQVRIAPGQLLVSEGEGHVSGRTVQHQGRSQQGVARHAVEGQRGTAPITTGAGNRPASRWSPRSRAHRPPRSRCLPLDCSRRRCRPCRPAGTARCRAARQSPPRLEKSVNVQTNDGMLPTPCAADSTPSQLPAGSARDPAAAPGPLSSSSASTPAQSTRLVTARPLCPVPPGALSSSALHHA